MEFTKELIDKVKACRTAEELLALANENGYELSPEEAELFLQDFVEGELAEEELNGVSGGAEGCKPPRPYEDVFWDRKEDVQFIFNEGDIVEAFADGCGHHTATCKVVSREVRETTLVYRSGRVFYDVYWLEKLPGVKSAFIKGWNQRHNIEMK